jgi:rhamnosyltransferase subunit B
MKHFRQRSLKRIILAFSGISKLDTLSAVNTPAFRSRPLRILLPTLGSAGDVHPTIALAIALQSRGHQTTILTNEFYGEQIRAAGINFLPLGTLVEGEKILADPRLWHPTKAFSCIAQLVILPNLRRLYRLIEKHADSSTVVVASGICLGARVAQEKLGIPVATVHLQPSMLRSYCDAGMFGRLPLGPGVPAVLKRALYWAADRWMIDRELAPELNVFRRELSLAPVRRIFDGYIHSPQLSLGLFDNWFAPVQPDWPRNLHLTGFVLYDSSSRREIPHEAEEFLVAGPPPVLFTPGSGAATLNDFFRESVEACRLTGLRAMLVTNFTDQLPGDLPRGIRGFPYLPFSRVLPRCCLMVYPGGIGTMAQTIQAGVPHLVVPHAHDQPDNAARVERLGLGKHIYPEKYRGAKVALLLKKLLSDTGLSERCRSFAARIQSDAALDKACSLIEGLAQKPD